MPVVSETVTDVNSLMILKANALGIFAPVITLALFAIVSSAKGDGRFDTATAFTSIALLWMVTQYVLRYLKPKTSIQE